jgi:mitochondrial import receptor subunit TOM40
MAADQEKPSSSFSDFFTSNAIFSRASEAVSNFQEYRKSLDLPNPGSVDFLSKEVERDVFLTNYSFTGLRADISRQLSVANPLFQVSHQFSMGSQLQPPYTFALLYGTPKVRYVPILLQVHSQSNSIARFSCKPI